MPEDASARSPAVYVVLLNWCAEDDTAACIESLLASDCPRMTILLVDNASADGSGGRLHERFPDVVYVAASSNLGFTGGNNLGMERAAALGADYLLVLNNDTVVEPQCVRRLVEAAEATGAAAVGGKICYFSEPRRIWYAGGDFLAARAMPRHRMEGLADEGGDTAGPVTFVTGCCFLLRTRVYRELGGFDDSYFIYVEDAELSVRLTRAGYTLWYEPEARLLHRIPVGSAEATPFQIRQRDRNRRRLARTHYSAAERIAFGLWYYPTRAAHLVRYLLRGKWDRAAAVVSGAFGSLRRSGVPDGDIRTRPVD